MSESTDRKMGPRESRQVREGCAHERCGCHDCPGLAIAQIADALEEALYEWKELLDAYVNNRPPPDERPVIAICDAKKIDRMRALLKEVDRG